MLEFTVHGCWKDGIKNQILRLAGKKSVIAEIIS